MRASGEAIVIKKGERCRVSQGQVSSLKLHVTFVSRSQMHVPVDHLVAAQTEAQSMSMCYGSTYENAPQLAGWTEIR